MFYFFYPIKIQQISEIAGKCNYENEKIHKIETDVEILEILKLADTDVINAIVCVCVWVCQLLSCVQPFATPWTIAHQAPLSMDCSSQEYWNGMGSHSLPQGIFPTQRQNSSLLYLRQILYHLSHQGSPNAIVNMLKD